MGPHPETGEAIIAGIGRYGPYVRHGDTYVSLRGDDVLAVGLNRAVALLADKPTRPKGRELGTHPRDGKPVTLKSGRYGPYVEHGGVRATLPKGEDAEALSLERAVSLVAEKKARGTRTRKGGTRGRGPDSGRAPPGSASAVPH